VKRNEFETDAKDFKKTKHSYKKTGRLPWKCPPVEVQEDFVEMYKLYEESAKKWDIHALFYDPMHQIHNSINAYMRQPKWKDWTINIQSNTGRSRLNIMWWIDIVTHEFVWDILLENCDAITTKETLHQIRNHYRNKKKIVIFLDNARYQRSYEIQNFAKKLWIELVYLPPYAPNLNLIERVWKFMKKKLSNNYYHTISEFYSAISSLLDSLSTSDEIKNLINWNFHIINVV